MRTRNTRFWLAVFFCSTGLVYSGPVGADEGATPAAPASGATPDAEPLFEGVPAGDPLPQGQQVSVGAWGKIDLHVKDLDLTKVLQLLSIQSQRNIIASKNVAGQVSADLYGVDFYQALDAILHSNGFGYLEKGQFIYVYTQDELTEMEKANRKLVSKIIRLNYISANDVQAFVAPLLSEKGTVALSGEPKAGMQPSISDGGSNSFAHADTLVIRDYQENIDEIVSVINELDIRPKQVMVEATVLQARLTETNAWGVDISVLIDYDLGNFAGSPLNLVDSLIGGEVVGGGADTPVVEAIGTGGGLQTGVGNTAAPGGFKVGVIGDNVSAFVRALDQVTDTTVVANPKLLVLNRQKADLLVGGELGYLSTTQTETATTQTVEFLEVGTQLTVRPFVAEEDMVRLELRPELSDGETVQIDGFVIPNKTTQQLVTNVMVRSGQTVVLGGLFKEDTTIGRRQVPGLGDVPLLGAAFSGQDDNVERSEVIFLIKPTVMRDEPLYAAGDQAREDITQQLIGSRKGLLPWSQTKLSTGYVREAVERLEAGDREKALWYTNLALYLDPTLVDALRLKQELTGERVYYVDDSILQHAIESTIDARVEQVGEVVEPEADAEAATTPVKEAQPVDPVAEAEAAEPAAPPVAGDDVTHLIVAEAELPDAAAEAAIEAELDRLAAEDNQQPTEPAMVEEPLFEGEPVEGAASVEPVNLLNEIDAWLPGADEEVAAEAAFSGVDVEMK